jgi:hypothetical protein
MPWILVFTALSDAEAISLRLEMLLVGGPASTG